MDRINLGIGESMTLSFPSGKSINVEVTTDTMSLVLGDTVLYSEERNDHRWSQLWPNNGDGMIGICELMFGDVFVHPETGKHVQLQDQMYVHNGVVIQAYCAEVGQRFTDAGRCVDTQYPVTARVKLVKRASEEDVEKLETDLFTLVDGEWPPA